MPIEIRMCNTECVPTVYTQHQIQRFDKVHTTQLLSKYLHNSCHHHSTNIFWHQNLHLCVFSYFPHGKFVKSPSSNHVSEILATWKVCSNHWQLQVTMTRSSATSPEISWWFLDGSLQLGWLLMVCSCLGKKQEDSCQVPTLQLTLFWCIYCICIWFYVYLYNNILGCRKTWTYQLHVIFLPSKRLAGLE